MRGARGLVRPDRVESEPSRRHRLDDAAGDQRPLSSRAGARGKVGVRVRRLRSVGPHPPAIDRTLGVARRGAETPDCLRRWNVDASAWKAAVEGLRDRPIGPDALAWSALHIHRSI